MFDGCTWNDLCGRAHRGGKAGSAPNKQERSVQHCTPFKTQTRWILWNPDDLCCMEFWKPVSSDMFRKATKGTTIQRPAKLPSTAMITVYSVTVHLQNQQVTILQTSVERLRETSYQNEHLVKKSCTLGHLIWSISAEPSNKPQQDRR